MDENNVICVGGVELEFDIFDAENAERFENAVEQVAKEAKDAEKQSAEGSMKGSEAIRRQCKSVFGFFNSVFGEGTDKKIFGERVNLIRCISAFEEALAQIDAQKSVLDAKLSKSVTKQRAPRKTAKK